MSVSSYKVSAEVAHGDGGWADVPMFVREAIVEALLHSYEPSEQNEGKNHLKRSSNINTTTDNNDNNILTAMNTIPKRRESVSSQTSCLLPVPFLTEEQIQQSVQTFTDAAHIRSAAIRSFGEFHNNVENLLVKLNPSLRSLWKTAMQLEESIMKRVQQSCKAETDTTNVNMNVTVSQHENDHAEDNNIKSTNDINDNNDRSDVIPENVLLTKTEWATIRKQQDVLESLIRQVENLRNTSIIFAAYFLSDAEKWAMGTNPLYLRPREVERALKLKNNKQQERPQGSIPHHRHESLHHHISQSYRSHRSNNRHARTSRHSHYDSSKKISRHSNSALNAATSNLSSQEEESSSSHHKKSENNQENSFIINTKNNNNNNNADFSKQDLNSSAAVVSNIVEQTKQQEEKEQEKHKTEKLMSDKQDYKANKIVKEIDKKPFTSRVELSGKVLSSSSSSSSFHSNSPLHHFKAVNSNEHNKLERTKRDNDEKNSKKSLFTSPPSRHYHQHEQQHRHLSKDIQQLMPTIYVEKQQVETQQHRYNEQEGNYDKNKEHRQRSESKPMRRKRVVVRRVRRHTTAQLENTEESNRTTNYLPVQEEEQEQQL